MTKTYQLRIPTLAKGLLFSGLILIALSGFAITQSYAQAGTSPDHPAFILLDSNGDDILQSGMPVDEERTCFVCHDPEELELGPIHPSIVFLDVFGNKVIESNGPVSTMMTCGACHDTLFIADHSFHALAGVDSIVPAGTTSTERPWDFSEGLFGKWDPINHYDPAVLGGSNAELGVWNEKTGLRHAGGGPAEELVQMNCFLCHLSNPNNEARVAALASGDYRWASTATLTNTPIVSMDGDDFEWNLDAFDEEGQLLEEYLSLADPKNENCAACHGEIHKGSDPLSLPTDLPWNTLTTGQIISGQKLNETGLNLLNKDGLTRSLDIHAERLLDCTSCHYSLNNPIFAQPDETLEHLTFDPRGLEIYEYLQNPLHQFARGQSAQSSIAPELKDTMRRCEGCHDATVGHDWLPYPDRHFSAVACESCHIPEVYGPALQQADWTVVTEEGQGVFYYRGIDGEVGQTESLITGFQPVLMQREDVDGGLKLAPYNLISAWYWVYGDPAMPVSTAQMQEAFLDRDGFRQEVIAVFDTDNNGAISQSELRLDSNEKYVAVTQWLMDLGLTGPRVVAELQPYSLNHNVTNGEWVTRDCQTCHTDNSVLTTPFSIAAYSPGGVVPEFLPGDNVLKQGEIFYNEDFSLSYLPQPQSGDLYILGHDSVTWVDWFGVLAFLGTLLGVVIHGGARAYFAAKATPTQAEIKSVYMYSVYERFWHWLQTLVILALIVTGFTIHKPDMFGFLSFSGMVLVHNILAVLLVINAALSLFYHLVSGEIQQFIPRPLGFFDQAVVQAKYYLQGIFRSEPHPIEKTRERKLNPLQQVVYFGILNVLLPAQVITGILIWGAQRWPNISNQLGGLDLLAPLHTLVAWTFLSFIVMHVYLTTTGHTPSAGIQAMITGWDEIETHSPQENNKEKERKEG